MLPRLTQWLPFCFFLKLAFTFMYFVEYVGKRRTMHSKQETKILCMLSVNAKEFSYYVVKDVTHNSLIYNSAIT